MENKRARLAALSPAIIAAVFAVDQMTKSVVRATLSICTSRRWSSCDHRDVLGSPLRIIRVFNSGSAFGFSQGSLIWIILAIVGVLAILRMTAKTPSKATVIAASLCLAGALGNLCDRIVFGGATDFLGVSLGLHHYVAINVADIALVLGLLMIMRQRGALPRQLSHATEPNFTS